MRSRIKTRPFSLMNIRLSVAPSRKVDIAFVENPLMMRTSCLFLKA